MRELDQIIHETVASGAAPFVAAGIADRSGLIWHGSAGHANDARPAGLETVFRLFSATKAIGSLMALIAIDRGLVHMDTPVADVVPSFDSLRVLEKITADGPVFRKPRTRATLRHLLTHTQGQAYSAFHPRQMDYENLARSDGAPAGMPGCLNYPLMFDPGSGFAYGIGTDWVGHLVATIDGRTVDRFVREEILEPLALRTTFFEIDKTDIRLAQVCQRSDSTGFDRIDMSPPSRPELYQMGSALYASAADYLRFLQFMLNRGELNGIRLFSRRIADLMFTDQLNGVKIPTPILSSLVPIARECEIARGARKTHTATCFMTVENSPGGRSAGSLFWSGLLNTHYWADPASNICAVFFTQMLPFCDADLMRRFEEFEHAVYARRPVR